MSNLKIKVNFFTHLENPQKSSIIKQILASNHNFIYCKKDFNYLIVLGGDGTMIDAMKKYYMFNIKIFLVNCGNFGFLSLINYEDINSKINFNHMNCLNYPLLKITNDTSSYYAINDFLLTTQNNPIQIDINIIDYLKYDYFGSGLFLCTALGSSGMNRSMNGPLLSQLDSYLFSEYLPAKIDKNNFLNQAIILNKKHEIICQLHKQNNNKIFLKIDGLSHQFNLSLFKIKLMFSQAQIILSNPQEINNKLLKV